MFSLLVKHLEIIICNRMNTANFIIYSVEIYLGSNVIMKFSIDDKEYKLSCIAVYDERNMMYQIHCLEITEDGI